MIGYALLQARHPHEEPIIWLSVLVFIVGLALFAHSTWMDRK